MRRNVTELDYKKEDRLVHGREEKVMPEDV